ncbi:peptidoglycan DD-metalloendopeptidase family protein [Bifidobacterium sp. ESL0790]|uniref:M23 family metallopeptidase n=1 Tax=Bifidobacterium sp. ESL0790 TaxID=2983233 RepID=UPI0023FA3EAE|nr:peptidoglycan DD-metalloendopeptidase family protein [Bifidobacterium sp. ESL0790]WEV71758.1 peptidoglycan DD-metalloendopeptidase family protein [Bifidobacterium sp. ESL0790]
MRDTCVEDTLDGSAVSAEPAGLVTGKECKAQFIWPVHPAVVIRKFNGPARKWEPGHRGVDIAAVEGTPLTAPASGFISFVGLVAGKSVVSIRHGRFTLTFEPAQTELPIGTPLVKGAPFATVAGVSDHCTGVCVHWGVKDAKRNYTDPEHKVRKEKIVLKPLDP